MASQLTCLEDSPSRPPRPGLPVLPAEVLWRITQFTDANSNIDYRHRVALLATCWRDARRKCAQRAQPAWAIPDERVQDTQNPLSFFPLANFSCLRHVQCQSPAGIAPAVRDLAALASLSRLQSLDFSQCSVGSDFEAVSTLTALTSLKFRNVPRILKCRARPRSSITSLMPLSPLLSLRVLDLSWTGHDLITGRKDLAALSSLSCLELLQCSGSPALDLSPLRPLLRLVHLDCSHCLALTDFSALSHFSKPLLKSLCCCHCPGLKELSAFSPLSALVQVDLSNSCNISDWGPISSMTSLNRLKLRNCALNDLRPLACLISLTCLHIDGNSRITDLGPLRGLSSLQQLSFRECAGIAGVGPLATLSALVMLDCSDCTAITNLAPLGGLTALERLYSAGCPARWGALPGLDRFSEDFSACWTWASPDDFLS